MPEFDENVQGWLQDSEFQQLSPQRQQQVVGDYFADEYGDDEFRGLPEAEQRSTVANFVNTNLRVPSPEEVPGRTVGGTLKDVAISAGRGVVGLGEAAVGLADIPTLGHVGKALESLGYDPEATKEFLGQYYSPAQKAATEEVGRARGFIGKGKAMLQHPSTIGHAVVESAPLMLGGAAGARALLAKGVVSSPLVAGAIGEGLVSAGGAAEEIRQQTPDGLLTIKESLIPVASGFGTGVFALVGGRVAQKLGIVDVDTFLAGGSNVTSVGIMKRIIGGGLSEGLFEELPQSMQEQVWLNAALDKPLLENVPEAGATGTLVGFAMGTGFNIFTGQPQAEITPEQEAQVATDMITQKQTMLDNIRTGLESGELSVADLQEAIATPEIQEMGLVDEIQALIERAEPAVKPEVYEAAATETARAKMREELAREEFGPSGAEMVETVSPERIQEAEAVEREAMEAEKFRKMQEAIKEPKLTGPQNLVSRILKGGGVKLGPEYNVSEMRQYPDLKRVIRQKKGVPVDDLAASLKAEGYDIEGGDDLIELLKTEEGRKQYAPEIQEYLVERDVKKSEEEGEKAAVAEMETVGISKRVGDLNLRRGDKVESGVTGEPDTYEVVGRDTEGNFILKDGQTIKVDEFDTLPIIGSVQRGGYQPKPTSDTPASKIKDATMVNDESMGQIKQRVLEGNKGVKKELEGIVEEHGLKALEDWMNPSKMMARLKADLDAQGMPKEERRAKLKPILAEYEKIYKEVESAAVLPEGEVAVKPETFIKGKTTLPTDTNWPALQLKDKTVLFDRGLSTHVQMMEKAKVDPVDVLDSGWVTPEGYKTSKTDITRISEQAKAKQRVIEKREARKVKPESKNAPVAEKAKEPWKMTARSREYAEMSIEETDRAAFGFAREDITTLSPEKLNIKWKDDYNDVVREQRESGLSKNKWAKTIDLSEPIDVIFEDGKFKVDDGYHRWYAGKILGKPLKVNVEIKDKPHRAIVQKALSEGKPVPKEVLAEYPDLKPKEAPSAKETVTATEKPKPGRAWVKGQWRPIITAREITRKGKKFGKIEVTLPNGKKVLLEKDDIDVWPGETKVVKTEPVSDAKTRLKSKLKEQRGSFSLKSKEGPAVLEDLVIVGKDVINQGHDTYTKFAKQMKSVLSDVWEKIRRAMERVFRMAKKALKSERGAITIEGKAKPPKVEVKPKEKPVVKPAVKKPSVGVQKVLAVIKKKERPAPTTEAEYTANRKDARNIKLAVATNARRVKSEIAEGVDKFLGAISTRLGNISPKLKYKLRRLDFDINKRFAANTKAVLPLLKKAKKMSRADYADWDLARKNSDLGKLESLITKYAMQKEYMAYRKVLDGLRKEAIDVGLEIGEIEEYAPRILKDSRGFLTAIGKAEEWPIYSRRIQERAVELGISIAEMTPDMKADIISNMIIGGRTGLGGISATKTRKLKKIPAYLNKYYMDSDAALMYHMHSMRKGIEARRFFGKIPKKVAEMRRRLHNAQSLMRELKKKMRGDISAKEREKLQQKWNTWFGLEKEYTAYIERYALQRDYTDNIGTYVSELIANEEIGAKDERIVNEILNARFHERGMKGVLQAYKNLSYIDTMGSPVSALTQIGDLAWAAYEGGLIRTLKYAYRSAKGKSRITKEDVGVERIAQEFADSGTLGNAVSWVFKAVGLEKIDSIGKEALLNTAHEKYQDQARKNPAQLKKKLHPIFEAETDSVIDDLVNNEITDNVKLLVYSRLLDFQPVALSEMPQKYLEGGNGRLFYMLKTFTLKQFDAFRNEAYNKIKKGDRAEKIEGMKNFIRLASFFVLANAGADELKDWILGRKTDFSDRMVDNFLRLMGVSKFVTWKARTEGVGSALTRQILFPVKFVDAAGKDIITAGDEKGLEVLGSVPLIGKLAYWHFGRGSLKREDLWDRRFRKRKAKLNKTKDKLAISQNKSEFRVKYKEELSELRKINRLQGKLNKLRKRINRLKSKEETPANTKRILQLEKKRTETIKKFLKE